MVEGSLTLYVLLFSGSLLLAQGVAWLASYPDWSILTQTSPVLPEKVLHFPPQLARYVITSGISVLDIMTEFNMATYSGRGGRSASQST